MKWLILLVAGLVAAEDPRQLGDRIITTERECDRLFKLNENWNTDNYNEKAVLYVDLYFLCEDSLAEDKYTYIDHFHVDLSQYPGDNAKFPVATSGGDQMVTKPPVRSTEDIAWMQKKLTDYLYNLGGKDNPLLNLVNLQSDLGQKMVDQQVTCELKRLLTLKHQKEQNADVSEDGTTAEWTECMNMLNCLKETFMQQHSFTMERYPEYFPILYKKRGTMINSPPKSDGESLCTHPVKPEVYKEDLKTWRNSLTEKLGTIENVAGGTMEDIKLAGVELIKTLKNLGMPARDEPMMTDEELDKLMDDVESITLMDHDDDEKSTGNVRRLERVGSQFVEKIGSLERSGIEKIEQGVQRVTKLTPNYSHVEKLAEKVDEHLKNIEDHKIKPAIKKTMKGLSNAKKMVPNQSTIILDLKEKSSEAAAAAGDLKDKTTDTLYTIKSEVKTKSKAVVEDVKGAASVVHNAENAAVSKVKEDGSLLLHKLKSKISADKDANEDGAGTEDEDEESDDEEHEVGSWFKGLLNEFATEYLPKGFENMHAPSLQKLVNKMSHNEEGDDLLTEEHIKDLLKDMKEEIKDKSDQLNIHEHEVKQAALLVKNIAHSILNAGLHGKGPAKDLDPREINGAKALINALTDYAMKEKSKDQVQDDIQDLKGAHELLMQTDDAPGVNEHLVNPEDNEVEDKEHEEDWQVPTAAPPTPDREIPNLTDVEPDQ